MTKKEEIISFLSDMIDALSWKKVILLSLFGTIVVALLVSFENRTALFNHIFGIEKIETIMTQWKVSEQSKNELQHLVNTQSIVGGYLVTEVNLKKNRRDIKTWYFDDPRIKEQINQATATLLPQPFFLDNNRKNNEQMLAALNNQFKCTPTDDTVYTKFLPTTVKPFPFVCCLAVPPFSGEFAGMITLFLDSQPTRVDIDTLKIELSRISIELYLRDIENRHSR